MERAQHGEEIALDVPRDRVVVALVDGGRDPGVLRAEVVDLLYACGGEV